MDIVIIGTGNVATVFGRMFKEAGNPIVQVYGRNAERAASLAAELESESCHDWHQITPHAGLYIVALADTALYELSRYLALTTQLVVHTAGAVPKDVLQKVSLNYGVMYPLQSLRKNLPLLTLVPLLVDGSDAETLNRILQAAGMISEKILVAKDEQRLKLHVAGVFINNFVNHLYAVTADFCRKENVDFNILLPLAAETTRRLEVISPALALTGPAIRHDLVTIERHLAVLKAHADASYLYAQMTQSIMTFHEKSAGK